MTVSDLNAMEQAPFVESLGWIFEHSPWVAERAWESKPFATLGELHAAMVKVVDEASGDEQLALICAHPDLGAKAKMSEASVGEQAGAGLNQLTIGEFETLHRLNSEYREKFGFPFIYAVKGATKHDILNALDERLRNNREVERATALQQIARIAWFRLCEEIR
jgi:2-oxo-4-hydroxy-4-carboxy-5-ureidoimidazoline decarboxylase